MAGSMACIRFPVLKGALWDRNLLKAMWSMASVMDGLSIFILSYFIQLQVIGKPFFVWGRGVGGPGLP